MEKKRIRMYEAWYYPNPSIKRVLVERKNKKTIRIKGERVSIEAKYRKYCLSKEEAIQYIEKNLGDKIANYQYLERHYANKLERFIESLGKNNNTNNLSEVAE